MRWIGGRESRNVEDRRGIGVSRGVAGGGIGTVVLVLVALFFGVDPSVILSGGGPVPSYEGSSRVPSPEQDEMRRFVSVVLADTEDTWHAVFRGMNRDYEDPKLVLFSGATDTGCGFALAAIGPFYCPSDRRVYLDLDFFRDLQTRFGAPGDFARAYVVAHEIGHHVQALLGISERVNAMRARVDHTEANQLSVRLELQADCFAGVWANQANRSRSILEQGDIEEGLRAASAVGDDRLQKQSRGYVVPESFTHGSSAQRVHWFKRGLASGDPRQCDTFRTADL